MKIINVKLFRMAVVKTMLVASQIASAELTIDCKHGEDLAKEVALEVAHDHFESECEIVKANQNISMPWIKQIGFKVDIQCEGNPLRTVVI